MPDSVARFTISVPPELLATFDEVSAGKGYTSRSEAVRDAIREYLITHDWGAKGDEGEVVGTITLVYDHEIRKLSDELLERQHRKHTHVLSSLHVHLDARNCLEVVVVRGTGKEVAALADELISLRGVKHGRLVCGTTGTDLP
jgi:CopG family transcriptional regulator, nickel-responsive regulator